MTSSVRDDAMMEDGDRQNVALPLAAVTVESHQHDVETDTSSSVEGTTRNGQHRKPQQ